MTAARRSLAAAATGRLTAADPESRRIDDPSAGRIGEGLWHRERAARAGVSPMRGLDLSSADAYSIQAAFVRSGVLDGQAIGGYKVGTAAEPAYGVVFRDRILDHEATISMSDLIRPAVEAEIGFVLAEPLRGPGITPNDVVAASAHLVACLEVVDSRISGRTARRVEVIADNGRAARVVVGDTRVPPGTLDLRLTGVVLERNGAVLATGAGAAVLGNPALSVAWLANELGRQGQTLEAGMIVLSGAITAAVPAQAGDEFRASIACLGVVACRFA